MSTEEKKLSITIDNSNVTEVLRQNAEMAQELKTLREAELARLKESKETGRGVLPANLNSDYNPKNEVKEFEGATLSEAHENMLSWAKINDPKAYTALKKQTLEAVANNKGFVEVKDYFDSEGRSCIGRALHRNNISKRPEKEI